MSNVTILGTLRTATTDMYKHTVICTTLKAASHFNNILAVYLVATLVIMIHSCNHTF